MAMVWQNRYNVWMERIKFATVRLTLGDPFEDIALEEALFRVCESTCSPPILRLWQPKTTYVVLGTGQQITADVDLEACQCDGVPILRRFSGGGTVTHGDGQLCWTMYLPLSTHPDLGSIKGSYRFVFSLIARLMADIGIELEFREPCDFSVANRKVSGNAQRRGKCGILHHGTLLVNCDIMRLGKYLREPSKRPEYRGDRVHGSFLTNLSNCGFSGGVSEIERLFDSLSSGRNPMFEPDEIVNEAKLLAECKYRSQKWIYRK